MMGQDSEYRAWLAYQVGLVLGDLPDSPEASLALGREVKVVAAKLAEEVCENGIKSKIQYLMTHGLSGDDIIELTNQPNENTHTD